MVWQALITHTPAWIANVCLGSREVLSCFDLTFVYEDHEVNNGTVFNPSFPVRANLKLLSFPMTHCSISVYVSVRNVCRSNPNETRIYGIWPRGSCGGQLAQRTLLPRWWLLERLPVRLLFIWSSEPVTDKISNSGCLNIRDLPLKIIRGNIWHLLLLRLVNITTPEMWEICLSPPIAFWWIVLRSAPIQTFQQTGTLSCIDLCQITDPGMLVLKG